MAVIGAWLAVEVNRAQRQERAVVRIRQAGGNIFYDYEDGEASSPVWLRRVVGNGLGARVNRVDALLLGLADSDMDDLSSLVDVRELWLWGNPISDDGVARLRLTSFRRLESLNLADTRVTDKGLSCLPEIPNLSFLALSGTQVSDEGIATVARCRKLTTLHLADTEVTDSGIMALRVLTNLREVNLLNTRVTDGGGAALQRALPRCNVYWGEI